MGPPGLGEISREAGVERAGRVEQRGDPKGRAGSAIPRCCALAGGRRPPTSRWFRAQEAALAQERQEGRLAFMSRAPGAVPSISVTAPAIRRSIRPSVLACVTHSESPGNLLGEAAPTH